MEGIPCGRNIESRNFSSVNRAPEKNSVTGETSMLKHLPGKFLKIESVSVAVVIARDGFIREGAVPGAVDREAPGAMASTGPGTSEAMGTSPGKGDLYQMLIERENGPILLSPLSPDELIAIVADSSPYTGRIRDDLKKNRERIIAAL